MSRHYTPACPLTEEDAAIMNATSNTDTLVGMLVDTCRDDVAIHNDVWAAFWAARQQYELDYIY